MRVLVLLFCMVMLATSAVVSAAADKTVTDADAQYFLDSINLEQDSIEPGQPQGEVQGIIRDMMLEGNAIEIEHNQALASVGVFEIEDLTDLSSKDNIRSLKDNLELVSDVQKKYYDDKAALYIKGNTLLGKIPPPNGRNPKTFTYAIEILERDYLDALSDFYTFADDHHSELIFQDDELGIEREETREAFNRKLSTYIKTAQEMAAFRAEMTDIMRTGLGNIKAEQ